MCQINVSVQKDLAKWEKVSDTRLEPCGTPYLSGLKISSFFFLYVEQLSHSWNGLSFIQENM